MEIQRTVTILLPTDDDLRATLAAFVDVQNEVSTDCFNGGDPLRAVPLQRLVYERVKGRLSSQMTITALRLVAGAYASAKRARTRKVRAEKRRKERLLKENKPYTERVIPPLVVCQFTRPAAMFLVGQRGRDADFRADGTLSLWTVGGRKHLPYIVPSARRPLFVAAKEIDSVTVIERDAKLYGRVALTLDVPEPKGVVPVGIDLNETNALVAVDADGRELFITGKETKVRNKRSSQTIARLQRKLAAKKAEGRSPHAVRRTLKRLARRRSRRTRDLARVVAKKLVVWAPQGSVLVFEKLRLPQPQKRAVRGVSLRRRLALWQHGAIRSAVQSKAPLAGLAVAEVEPAHTSQNCSRCGLRGERKRHVFSCPHCGHTQHADLNAAVNIRSRFVQLRLDGASSVAPEALPVKGEGKRRALARGN